MNINDLGKQASAIGELIGLINNDNGNISVNTGWFGSPISNLEDMPKRMNVLVGMISSYLGKKAENAPAVFTDAEWYQVPDPRNGSLTPFYFVASPASKTSGQLGLGLLVPNTIGNLQLQAYIYLPLFNYSPNGTNFIAGSAHTACQVGLYNTPGKGNFSVTTSGSTLTFKAMNLNANIFLAGDTPNLTLNFVDLKNASFTNPVTTLAGMKDPQVLACIGEVALQADYWLHTYIGHSNHTIGDILTTAHFLSKDTKGNYHIDISNLQGDAKTIALNFAFAALDALSSLTDPILPLFNGGIYVEKTTDESNNSKYGLRFAADISLNSEQTTEGKSPPEITINLGSWMTGESDDHNWMNDITGNTVNPGLTFNLLNRSSSGTAIFAAGFNMSSVGVSVFGGGDNPLINLGGYRLDGAEMRVSIDPENHKHGFAIRLDNAGIPLGPTFQQAQSASPGNNTVAKNLIASDGSGDASKNAVNPTFSAKTGYITGYSPYFRLYDAKGLVADTVWFPVQRRFGPVSCNKVGIKIDTENANDPVMGIIFDGDVKLGMLDIYLDQLAINVHLKRAADISGYNLDLQGLGITFHNSSVEISGALVKTKDVDQNILYNGEAMLKFQNLMLTALGSYGSLPDNGGTSLFVFAMLNYPIGGPPFFYVTGLSAGFGYNRALKLPDKDNVTSFPLLTGLSNPSSIGGGTDPVKALKSLTDWVPPKKGEYFLAAGVQFTTFELLKTNALLVVAFGNDLSISVLGVSTLRQPMSGRAYVYAQLGINAQFLPSKGEVKVSAILAPGSYVITPEAHITGGFAFYSWFGNSPHSGDFVFTIGGYHPSFKKPAWYPDIPRVGINWQISDQLAMTGGAYFAITPSCMMAGGDLAINFEAGNLKAWFKASINILLFYKPFYLIADASVSVGVSYRIHVLFVDETLSVEIGANFSFYGSPIGGNVHIDWYIISFTIHFGPSMDIPSELSWDDFKGLLPKKNTQQPAPKRQAMMLGAETLAVVHDASPANDSKEAYVYIHANDGLLSTQTVEGITLWLVRADQFKFTAGSAIPNTSIQIQNVTPGGNVNITGGPVGMQKVYGGIEAAKYKCTQTIAIIKLSHDSVSYIKSCMATSSPCTAIPVSCKDKPIDISDWQIETVIQNMPTSVWGPTINSGPPSLNPDTSTVAGTMGVTINPKPTVINNCTPEMAIDMLFANRVVNPNNENRLPLSQVLQPPNPVPVNAKSFTDIKKIGEDGVVGKRTNIFRALQGMGINANTNNAMTNMGSEPASYFADEPMEGSPVAVVL